MGNPTRRHLCDSRFPTLDSRRRSLVTLLAALALCGCQSRFGPDEASRIYFNGEVVTVDADNRTAEAIAIRGEEILAVGSRDQILKHRVARTEIVDLDGKTIVPGFIDAHGHMVGYGALSQLLNLSPPPFGAVDSIPELQEALRSYIRDEEIADGTAVTGVGYDDAILIERRHPTRAELDEVSTRHQIYLIHVSGHLGVANSAALDELGIDETTPDPPGGRIDRDPVTGELSGRLEENAHIPVVMSLVPKPRTPWGALRLFRDAEREWFRHGQTTICDGRTSDTMWPLLSMVEWLGLRDADVLVQLDFDTMKDRLAELYEEYGDNREGVRVTAAKLTLDGSPQGKTAWLSQPYLVPPEGEGADYAGYPIYTDEELHGNLAAVLRLGMTFHAHVNGDAAIDQLIRVVERLKAEGLYTEHVRPVAIHAQTTRFDQLDEFAELNIVPSFYVLHTFAWGDWHREQILGDRAERISPAAAAAQRGIRFTLSHDAPVTPPDILMLMWSAVNRVTRSGHVLGPDQRVTPLQALRAVTIDAAYQYREDDRKGSLEPGKLADLVILSDNPLTVDPMAIKDIAVVETIKRGETVHRAP
jgi:predicted amidohydrolase YtcJ